MYQYNATVINVIEGDLLDMQIDLGYGVTIMQRVKLIEVSTPRLRPRKDQFDSDSAFQKHKEAAKKAKAYVQETVNGKSVRIVSTKSVRDQGRYLVELFYKSGGTELNLNLDLLDLGLASRYDDSEGG